MKKNRMDTVIRILTIVVLVSFAGAAICLIGSLVWWWFGGFETKYYPIPEYFISLPDYQGESHKFLGRKGHAPEDAEGGIYTLKGLDKKDFILHKQSYIMAPNSPPTITIYMHENRKEPVLCPDYEIKKIDICLPGAETFVIEDKKILRDLLTLRREGTPTLLDDSYVGKNTTFYFDLPCQLTWKCRVERKADDQVYLICYDVKTEKYYQYDATSILSALLPQSP